MTATPIQWASNERRTVTHSTKKRKEQHVCAQLFVIYSKRSRNSRQTNIHLCVRTFLAFPKKSQVIGGMKSGDLPFYRYFQCFTFSFHRMLLNRTFPASGLPAGVFLLNNKFIITSARELLSAKTTRNEGKFLFYSYHRN